MTASYARCGLAALAALLVAGCGPTIIDERSSTRMDRERLERLRRADPSKVIATELAFARTAQEKGQWTAFAEYAADDAVMFVPEPVNARGWLRGQANPAEAVRWQPHQVWSSCDGTLAVTKGAWQRPDGSIGYFTTVWQRQGNGEYKWVMDQGASLAQPLEAPEMVGATVADCGPSTENLLLTVTTADLKPSNLPQVMEARDESLVAMWTLTADNGREFRVWLRQGAAMQEVLTSVARGE